VRRSAIMIEDAVKKMKCESKNELEALISPCNKKKERIGYDGFKKILEAKNLGSNNDEITKITNYSESTVTSVLESLSKQNNDIEAALAHFCEQQIVEYFNKIYASIEIKISVPGFEKMRDQAYKLFCSLKSQFKEGTKYNAVEKLAPVAIYLYYASIGINVDIVKYVKALGLDRKDFLRDLFEGGKRCRNYLIRDKKAIVEKKLLAVKEALALNLTFEAVSGLVLNSFWKDLSNTKESVIAATVSALALVYLDLKKPTISRVCNALNVKMSAVIYQIKNKLFANKTGREFTTITQNKGDIVKIVSQKIQQARFSLNRSKDNSLQTRNLKK